MKYNQYLAFLLFLLVVIPVSCNRESTRPNILLITLDTTRTDHLTCYGYKEETSPNLDTLAEEGTLYKNCISMTSWTLPSHASLFTGLFPVTHGAHYNENAKLSLNNALDDSPISKEFKANGLSEDAHTLAEILDRAGYTTGGVGGGPWLEPIFGLSQGFGFYNCDALSVAGKRADEINDLAIPFIRKATEKEKPFFLFLNYFDPHFPYNPPRKYLYKFWNKRLHGRPGHEVEDALRKYDGEILFMDEHLGMVFNELKRRGVWDDTWVIVTADHGEQFAEKGYSGHGFSLFEQTLRIPLIMKTPKGWKPIGHPEELVQLVNIMPTILERLDIDPAGPMDARPMGRGTDFAVAELYKNVGNVKFSAQGHGARYDRNLKALYQGEYKLICSTKENDEDAGLFHPETDPLEMHDLTLEHPDKAESLLETLARWKDSLSPPLDPRVIEEVDAETEELLKGLGY